MKTIKKYIHILILAAVWGGLLVSCTKDVEINDLSSNDGDGIASEGKGMMSVALRVDKLAKTKTLVNFAVEDLVREVRVILYDMQGKALYIKDFEKGAGDIGLNYDEDNNYIYHTYQTPAFEVDLRPYQAAILVNFKNEWTFYTSERTENSDMDARTSQIGHDASVLSQPFDFSSGSTTIINPATGDPITVNNYKTKTYAMQTLSGIWDTRPSYIDPSLWNGDQAWFFMSNADGLVSVPMTSLKSKESEALAAPVSINVERALAKVVFMIADEINIPDNMLPGQLPDRKSIVSGSSFRSMGSWRVDTHNTQAYPMRQLAPIAPYSDSKTGGSTENKNTDRIDRYAIDPNHATNNTNDFFYIPAEAEDPIYTSGEVDIYDYSTYFNGTDYLKVFDGAVSDDYLEAQYPYEYDYIEYVTENTVSPDFYDTRYTTNILLRLKVRFRYYSGPGDPAGASDGDFQSQNSYSYVILDGVVYPAYFVAMWLNGEFEESAPEPTVGYYSYPDKIQYTAAALDAAYPTASERQELLDFLRVNTGGSQTTGYVLKPGVSAGGLQFIYEGNNYYRIPIRHFNDTQSPLLNEGYGRYGVVRNNTYVLILKSVTGFGYPEIPPPGPIVETEKTNIAVTAYIFPWFWRVYLHGSLGQEDNGGGGGV